MTTDEAILITGAGLSTILGDTREATWKGVLEGRRGLAATARIEPDDPASQGVTLEAAAVRRVALEAIADAVLDATLPYAPHRRAVILGTTLHGIRGAGRYIRRDDPRELGDVPAPAVCRDAFGGLNIRGPRLTTCSACSSGLASLALGVTLLRAGMADVVLVGGYDPVAEYSAAGFTSLRLVAEGLPRPFCRDRQGLRIGPGFGVLVLERAGAARARGATARGEIVGIGESADAFHLTRPHPQGKGAACAMRAALANANLSAGDIDLIIAHATGTPANDAAEFQALSDVFEARLGQTPLVAFKSHLGHTLGAAGAVELVLALLAMRDGLVPPVANVASDELEFDGLDLTFGGPRAAALSTALSLSIGFGGANACAVVRTPATTNGEGRTGPTEPAREVAVTGLGAIVPGAIGNEQLLELLLTERPVVRGGPIDDASLEPILARFRLRRQSAYSKLSIGAVSLALADAAIEDIGAFTAECGAIFGTAHGSANYSEAYYREIVASGPAAANPMLFAEGVPNAGAAQVSIAFGINGGCQTIVGARTSGVEALALAAARIRNGEWRRAIVCAADESNEAVNAGYEACGLTGPDGGFTPGAGAGAVVLELADDARARGATIAATVGACGLACAEIDDARSIERAIGLALDAASPAGPIVGSANGSRLDRIERDAVDRHPAASVQAYVALDSRLAEMFSAGPLVAMAGALLAWREFDSARAMAWVDASEISVLAVDPLGPVACVSLLRA